MAGLDSVDCIKRLGLGRFHCVNVAHRHWTLLLKPVESLCCYSAVADQAVARTVLFVHRYSITELHT